MKLRIGQHLAASLFFLAFGAAGLWVSGSMPIGTAAEMGVGYVPRLLAFGCLGVGALQLAGVIVAGSTGPSFAIEARPLLFVGLIVACFAGLLPLLGLPLTIALLVFATTLSGESYQWTLLGLTAALLSSGAVVLFGLLLRLQIPLWPAWWPMGWPT